MRRIRGQIVLADLIKTQGLFAAPLPRCVAHRQEKKVEFEKHNQTSSPFQEKTRNYLTGVPDCRTSPPPWRLQGEDKSRQGHYPHEPCIYNRCRAITSTISRARSLDQNYRKRITNHGADGRRSQTPRRIRLWEQTTGSMRVVFMNARPGQADGQLEEGAVTYALSGHLAWVANSRANHLSGVWFESMCEIGDS